MKILIVSDSHGLDYKFMELKERVTDIDMLIHCGDIEKSAPLYRKALNVETHIVAGNNDYRGMLPEIDLIDVGAHRILVTHGHREHVSYGLSNLYYKAAELGADIVLFGHTHVPHMEYDEDLKIWAVNPGSLSLPRQEGRKSSYAIMEIDRFDEVHFTINFL